jgi:hypothetical protein
MIDRSTFAAELRTNAAASTSTHRRKILGINISDDRRSASIESEESETVVIGGMPKSTTSHSVDEIAIIGESIVQKDSTTELMSLK